MDKKYNDLSYSISRIITVKYSTSFSIGVKCLGRDIRNAVYAIYGFIRLADEIVDSFHGYDRRALLAEFEKDYRIALERGISPNPVINAFQDTVRNFNIDHRYVDSFLESMKMDLREGIYDHEKLTRYIYGSAEVVGLMCLKVFVRGNEDQFKAMEPYARRLGAAFQKINFLRDLHDDTQSLHRIYFPVLRNEDLNEKNKMLILEDLYEDFREAEKGIKKLPRCAKMGVYTAYLYYLSLAKAIEDTPAGILMSRRIRVSNKKKVLLLGKACIRYKFI
ncbi:MAG: phytoene/squalene synthase family protein [Rikenellaceae bacterium]|nr:phytoene/squalene synthase family protein [Rikenellaceae bacterium]